MAGRRLLDAAKLFNASRSVAKHHFVLRSQQWDVFTQTSTLAKAVKNQTDRVTVTAQAAYALAKRFNEQGPSYGSSDSTVYQSRTQHDEGAIPRQETVNGAKSTNQSSEGLAQDHHYKRSGQNAVANPVPKDELEVTQEKPDRHPLSDGTIPPKDSSIGRRLDHQNEDTFAQRPVSESSKSPLSEDNERQLPSLDVTQKKAKNHPLPDGTVPPKNTNLGTPTEHSGHDTFAGRSTVETAKKPLLDETSKTASLKPTESNQSTIPLPSNRSEPSSELNMKAQRQSEFQIPSFSGVNVASTPGADTFNTRPMDSSAELSSLPRMKIPKTSGNNQGGDEHIETGINQDVFYSSKGDASEAAIPTQEAVPGQDEVPEGINTDVFHSPRVASMLGSKGKEDRRKAYELKMKAAKGTPIDQSPLAQGKNQDTFNVRQSTVAQNEPAQPAVSDNVSEPRTKESEEDIKAFADSLAQDVTGGAPPASESPAEEPNSTPYKLRESRVPSSRFGRLWQYGGLATSMAFGAVGESFRRVTGGGENNGSLMLSPANMERLVAKLSRMRGAALKLGQMMSFQDSKMLPPAINAVLQRVQDSADYMPPSQRNQVLSSNLGPEWKDLFSSFDDVPIAAASIGQVHRATMASTGQEVAVKIQYPGVRNSIDSDLSNLSLLLTASRLLPKGLYLDKTIANARTELGWECDYIREAESAQRFASLVADEPDTFVVPSIVQEASGPEVLTATLMTGTAVTKVPDLTQSERDWIGTQILRLCLRELMEWQFMQTDPNWTNFLYRREAATGGRKLELLDFGASREFPTRFVTPYIKLLIAASRNDRAACRDLSIELGYLTGGESSGMLAAHVDSIMTLAEPFLDSQDGGTPYDFRDQTITDRVREKIGVMVRERLAPPPEETYSLHRKLSGAFLLCARLGSKVPAKELFDNAVKKWEAKNAS
ncbi:hypothetical protein MBLNU459_g5388t1 [Dothideomycetes sp. NU459]